MGKKWIIISLAVGLLTVAITGSVALAGGLGNGHNETRLLALAGKVAAILGTDADATADAIAQARQELHDEAHEEALNDLAGRVATTLGTSADATASAIEQVAMEMRNEALESKLQEAIASGKITEEEAQETRDMAASSGWHTKGFALKGDASEDFGNRVGAILGVEGADVTNAVEQAIADSHAEAVEAQIQAAVESGKITEEEAAQIREKIASGDWKGFGKHGHHGKRGGKHHHGFGGLDGSPNTSTGDDDSV